MIRVVVEDEVDEEEVEVVEEEDEAGVGSGARLGSGGPRRRMLRRNSVSMILENPVLAQVCFESGVLVLCLRAPGQHARMRLVRLRWISWAACAGVAVLQRVGAAADVQPAHLQPAHASQRPPPSRFADGHRGQPDPERVPALPCPALHAPDPRGR